jgi:hypothetical protein
MGKRLKTNEKESYQQCYKAENANHQGPASSDLLHPNGMMSSGAKLEKEFTSCVKDYLNGKGVTMPLLDTRRPQQVKSSG